VTKCATEADLLRFAKTLDGQLTATIHGTPEDLREHADLVRILERKVGTIIFNGFGTGLGVCPSMHHGGPYPAASHSFFTSIGAASIYRFRAPSATKASRRLPTRSAAGQERARQLPLGGRGVAKADA